MRNLLGFLVGLALSLLCMPAFSQAMCTIYAVRIDVGGGPDFYFYGNSREHACYSGLAELEARAEFATASTGTAVVESFTTTGNSFGQGQCVYRFDKDGGGSSPHYNQAIRYDGMNTCVSDLCLAVLDLADPVIVMGATSFAGQMCGSDDGHGGSFGGGTYGMGCAVVKNGAGVSSASGHWYGQVSYTGASCSPATTPVNTASTANCLTVGGGSLCVSKEVASEVTVSGEAVDVAAVPEGGCTLLNNGGALCEASATDVPTVSGSPATPTAQLSHTDEPLGETEGDSDTVNYYNSNVVSSSETTVVGGGNSYELGGGGGGGEGGSVDDLEGGDMETLDGIGDTAGGFWDRVEGSPLVSAVSGLSGSLAGGTCPAWQTTVEAGAFGTYDIDFGFMCAMWEDIAPIIAAVMLAGWALVGIRIIMSA